MTPTTPNFRNFFQKSKALFILTGVGILAISAVSVSLIQRLRSGLFAPTAPESKPAAYQVKSQTCHMSFEVVAAEPSPTSTTAPTDTLTPTATLTNEPSPTEVASPTNTPIPTNTFTITPSETPFFTETPTITVTPSETPQLTLTDSPTPEASSTPALGSTCNPIRLINSSDTFERPFRMDDNLQIECGQVANATQYKFRLILPGGSIIDLNEIAPNARLSQPFTPATFNAGYGRYNVQCVGCIGDVCQDWEPL